MQGKWFLFSYIDAQILQCIEGFVGDCQMNGSKAITKKKTMKSNFTIQLA